MTRLARRAVAVVVALVATTVASAGFVALDAPVAQATTTAVVVIDTGSSVRAVEIDVGGGTSGIEALRRAASVETVGYGGIGVAVCRIDGVGNPPDGSCLIGPGGAYWSYWRSQGGASSWTYSGGGAGATTVRGGDVEGWRYGTGAQPRAAASYCDHVGCAPPPPPPAPEPAPAPAPAPSPAPAPAPSPDATTATPRPAGGGSTTATGTDAGTVGGKADGATGGDAKGTKAGDATASTGSGATSTTEAGERDRRRLDDDRETALAASSGGDDGGGGSPVGVLVAGGLLVAAAVAAVMIRRRTRTDMQAGPG